ncbi:MAG: beta-glucuronidase [Bacteroidales bacterium]|nr:beta-glucuronidase [Candidatus Liminaster caballi]
MRQLIVIFLLLLAIQIQARQVIDLPGLCLSKQATPPNVKTQWTYQPYDKSFYENPWYEPYRQDGSFLIPYFLTPKTYFIGEEDYVRHVQVPADWADKHITLELERVHIKSRVWVNGVEAQSLYHCPEMQNGARSLAVPHRYDLSGLINAGSDNELRFSISNTLDSVPVGHNSYSVSDDDQGNWNGIVGNIRLIAQPSVHLDYLNTAVHPEVSSSRARVYINICVNRTQSNPSADNEKKRPKPSSKPQQYTIRLTTEAGTVEQAVLLSSDTLRQELVLVNLDRRWDEWTPNLYHLNIELLDRKKNLVDSQQLTFGMREVRTNGHFVEVNGCTTLVRGNVDGAHFPLTGYPPTDVDFWMKYLKTVKDWGANTIRFHSWCPPEAAFVAADSIGLYLQPECSSWPNHSVSLNDGNPTANYLWQEAEQIISEYGNHPSFVFLALGNEPRGGTWQEFSARWLNYWKTNDSRRLYTSFSVGGSWPWVDENQINVRAGQRGLEWGRRYPESMSDFHEAIDSLSVPFVGHEVGQWCSYPDLNEIDQYTGFMQPGNLIIFRDKMREMGLLHLADSFLLASGRLQTVWYKHELEKIRRTASYGGYHLQALADYPGQGTATEGVLNVFYQPKGYCQREEWMQWAGPVVPLMRTPRFIYQDADTLRFSLEVSNFGPADLIDVPVCYQFVDESGHVCYEKSFDNGTYAQGKLSTIAKQQIALSGGFLSNVDLANTPTKLKMILRVGENSNSWDFWFYPENPRKTADATPSDRMFTLRDPGNVYVTSVPDEQALRVLRDGGNVLLLCHNQVNYGRDIKQMFQPVFWNVLWLSRYSPDTHGLLIADKHPAFRHFPTSWHSDLQWWELVNRCYPMLLDEMPADLKPLVRVIDNAYKNRPLGMMFEAKVGKGRIIVTNMDLKNNLQSRIVARQLLRSLLIYMNSEEFAPSCTLEEQQIVNLFVKFKHT